VQANFIVDCYQKTGWLPAWPFNQPIALGDVCQLQAGRLVKIIPCVQLPLVEPINSSPPIRLDAADWQLASHVRIAVQSHETLVNEQGHEQSLAAIALHFERPGAYVFCGGKPSAQFITNWAALQQDIALKIVQLHFSLRQALVITRVAQVAPWSLAIAAGEGGHLEIQSACADTNMFRHFEHVSVRLQQSRNLVSLELSQQAPALFFQAKKLVLTAQGEDQLLKQLMEYGNPSALSAFARYNQADLAAYFKNAELGLNSVQQLYGWANLGLDEVMQMAAQLWPS
jgi:hypothetical protein